jgi:hypothetical protein
MARPAGPVAPPPDATRATALAGDFARRHADLLGISGETIAGLETGYAVERRAVGETAVVSLASAGPIPYPGYEHLAGFGYRVRLRLEIAGETVIGLVNQTDRLPDFGKLNTTPSVGPDSPAILSQMIGRELFYFDFAGQERSAGKIERGDIGPPLLTIEARERDDGALWIGLVWRYEVTRDGLPWTFTFNAHTGELIDVEQQFET